MTSSCCGEVKMKVNVWSLFQEKKVATAELWQPLVEVRL